MPAISSTSALQASAASAFPAAPFRSAASSPPASFEPRAQMSFRGLNAPSSSSLTSRALPLRASPLRHLAERRWDALKRNRGGALGARCTLAQPMPGIGADVGAAMGAAVGAAMGARNQIPLPSATDNWWERRVPANMRHVATTAEFVEALAAAGDKLVVVDFFGTWCRSCRAMHPKLCMLASKHPDVIFLQVEFDPNKQLCRSLGIKRLPFFHFYRGADGLLDAFNATLTSIAKVKEALAVHGTDRCSLGPPAGPHQVLNPPGPAASPSAEAAVAA